MIDFDEMERIAEACSFTNNKGDGTRRGKTAKCRKAQAERKKRHGEIMRKAAADAKGTYGGMYGVRPITLPKLKCLDDA